MTAQMTAPTIAPTSAEAFQENTKEQYEALGRFVEAFEMMVSEVRETCLEILKRDNKHYELLEIAFHHGALTARPLFDVMQALVAEIVGDTIRNPPFDVGGKGPVPDFTAPDRNTFWGVMKFVAEEYGELTTTRNNLLHATWFTGYSDVDDPFGSEFYARKYSAGKDRLSSLDLPKDAITFVRLSNRCDALRHWIIWLRSCVFGESPFAQRFVFEKQTWWLVTYSGSKTTLPER